MPARPVVGTTSDTIALQSATLPGDAVIDHFDRVYVIRHRGAPVAFLGLHDWAPYWCLDRAGVLDKFAGRGLYQRLLRYALRDLNAPVVTYTHRDNLASANGLLRAGFRLYEPTVRWGWPDGLYFYADPR